MQKTSHGLHLVLLICCFAFLFFVMLCAPPASDDLEFSALHFESVSDFMSYVLYYGNGRVLGNMGALSINMYPVAGAAFKAFVITCIVFLLPAVLQMKRTYAYWLSFLLVIGIDSSLFSEVFSWTCGFANYVPPIAISLSILYLLEKYPGLRRPVFRLFSCIYIILFGFLSQFYVEHSSGVNVLLAAFAVLCSFMMERWKPIRLPALLWLAATGIGIAGMFLVPKIFFVAGNRAEGYQQFHLNGLMAMLYSCVRNGIRLCNFYLGTPALAVGLGGFMTIHIGREGRSEKLTSALYTVNFALFVYLLFMTLMTVDHWNGRHAILHHALSAAVVVLIFAVWVIAVLGVEDGCLRGKIMLVLGFAVISLLPLLVVSPTPNRLIFQSYIFVAMGVLLCATEILEKCSEVAQKRVLSGCVSASIVLAVMIGIIFAHSWKMNEIREQHILSRMEAGDRVIDIFAIPYDYVFWDGGWEYPYHYYYEEPGDIEFHILNLDPWGVKYLEANPYS